MRDLVPMGEIGGTFAGAGECVTVIKARHPFGHSKPDLCI